MKRISSMRRLVKQTGLQNFDRNLVISFANKELNAHLIYYVII